MVSLPSGATLATGSPDGRTIGGRLRAAYTVSLGDFYIRPSMLVDVVNTQLGSFQELNTGGYGLAVGSSSQTAVVATPLAEVGARTDFANGMVLRSYVSGGVSLSSARSMAFTARFVNGPAGAGYGTSVPLDQVTGRVAVGAQLFTTSRAEVRAQYDGAFSGNRTSTSGTLVASWRF